MCHFSKYNYSAKVHYNFYNSSALIPTPIEINTVHIFTWHLFEKRDKLTQISKLSFSSCLFPVCILICNLRAISSAYLLLLNPLTPNDL
jgi:hypothetical protein